MKYRVKNNISIHGQGGFMQVSEADAEITRLETELAASIQKSADCVPTNWCDGLLVGDDSPGELPWACPQVEQLLRGVKTRILALQ